MTKQEAISELQARIDLITGEWADNDLDGVLLKYREALRMAVESLQSVSCGECKWFRKLVITAEESEPYCARPGQLTCDLTESDYCSKGELK